MTRPTILLPARDDVGSFAGVPALELTRVGLHTSLTAFRRSKMRNALLGVEAQVDWYEAVADLAGERRKLQVFSMRSMASGAAFHCAFLHATQQAFLEA